MTTLAQLNASDRPAFTAALAEIYEHSPWIADEAFAQRPFATRESLHAAMKAVVAGAPEERQLALLKAHPELAGRAAMQGDVTTYSKSEQGGSGLLQCTREEFDRLQTLNRAYNERFGFPFIIAVRGLDRTAIIAAFERRLNNTRPQEMAEALSQVDRIGGFRLDALVGDA